MLWVFPVFGVLYFFKFEKKTWVLALSLLAILLLSYREYSALNQRYAELIATPESLTLIQKSGQKRVLAASEIRSFTSISIGRFGGHSCSLMVKTKQQRFFSFVVEKQQHSCLQDAQSLKDFYKL